MRLHPFDTASVDECFDHTGVDTLFPCVRLGVGEVMELVR